MNNVVYIGSDHAGFGLKKEIMIYVESLGFRVVDCGTHSELSCDYPDYAHEVARRVSADDYCKGILICGSANGVAMTANKHVGVRAALCWQILIAELARQHNDANILCLPSRFVNVDQAKEITSVFFKTSFEGGRHILRVNKIDI